MPHNSSVIGCKFREVVEINSNWYVRRHIIFIKAPLVGFHGHIEAPIAGKDIKTETDVTSHFVILIEAGIAGINPSFSPSEYSDFSPRPVRWLAVIMKFPEDGA